MDDMSELIRYIASYLVDDPRQITITEVEDETMIHLKLSVSEEDTGKVIGRQGRIAKAIRAILKSASSKTGKKYVLDII